MPNSTHTHTHTQTHYNLFATSETQIFGENGSRNMNIYNSYQTGISSNQNSEAINNEIG
jgi:hypothetical protein